VASTRTSGRLPSCGLSASVTQRSSPLRGATIRRLGRITRGSGIDAWPCWILWTAGDGTLETAKALPGVRLATCWPRLGVGCLRPVTLASQVTKCSCSSSPGNADERWIAETLNLQLGNLPLVRVGATPGGADYWGTGKLVEAVICPADPDGLAREVLQSLEAWACLWCGELIAHSPCPLCGHRARPRRRSHEGVR